MFKKLFGLGSKTNEETIVAPLTGAVKNIEEVPDPVFAGRMMVTVLQSILLKV